jgi:hypothetical protein
VGEVLILKCYSDIPGATFEWLLGEIIVATNSVYSIPAITEADMGIYTCRATLYLTTEATIDVQVVSSEESPTESIYIYTWTMSSKSILIFRISIKL